jgi:hypothetical protein
MALGFGFLQSIVMVEEPRIYISSTWGTEKEERRESIGQRESLEFVRVVRIVLFCKLVS